MGLRFTPERKDTLKEQIDTIKQGQSDKLVIDQYVTEEELKEIFELGSLSSLDISFLLISKNVLEDNDVER